MRRALALLILILVAVAPIITHSYTYTGTAVVGTYYDGTYDGLSESFETFWAGGEEVTFDNTYPQIIASTGGTYVIVADAGGIAQLIQLDNTLTPITALNISAPPPAYAGFYTLAQLPLVTGASVTSPCGPYKSCVNITLTLIDTSTLTVTDSKTYVFYDQNAGYLFGATMVDDDIVFVVTYLDPTYFYTTLYLLYVDYPTNTFLGAYVLNFTNTDIRQFYINDTDLYLVYSNDKYAGPDTVINIAKIDLTGPTIEWQKEIREGVSFVRILGAYPNSDTLIVPAVNTNASGTPLSDWMCFIVHPDGTVEKVFLPLTDVLTTDTDKVSLQYLASYVPGEYMQFVDTNYLIVRVNDTYLLHDTANVVDAQLTSLDTYTISGMDVLTASVSTAPATVKTHTLSDIASATYPVSSDYSFTVSSAGSDTLVLTSTLGDTITINSSGPVVGRVSYGYAAAQPGSFAVFSPVAIEAVSVQGSKATITLADKANVSITADTSKLKAIYVNDTLYCTDCAPDKDGVIVVDPTTITLVLAGSAVGSLGGEAEALTTPVATLIAIVTLIVVAVARVMERRFF